MRKIIIFGAGLGGRRANQCLRRGDKVIAFADNNPNRQGEMFLGKKIMSPVSLAEGNFDGILIASQYAPQIFQQLVELGIDQKKIEVADYDIILGNYEVPSSFKWGVFATIALLAAVVAAIIVL
ncbi:hypothetical protein [Pelagicoccus sp. SDUM812002]|uniref:nucleoside-diphosphate sugar epimerase/dehydratase n=1 Tax=Pelagicoccus sp. SDUM812002 TaxID=3041266 RepID=UPI00280FD4DA|nr:hypothetical protein [Pelagicoccus sp. SDUM812002]MDQ8186434.1 hypothetical protein [Pelagicoccus sp. SDUM812002]